MSATKKQKAKNIIAPLPELAVPTAVQAMKRVNRWLQSEVGMAVSVSQAFFNATNYSWHLPIHLAYGSTGPLGVIGDIYLHAATGEFLGRPNAEDLQQRATALAEAHGFMEED